MADLTKTVAIVFQGQDQTSAALSSVERGLTNIGTSANSAATGTNSAADAANRLGASAASVTRLDDALKALSIGLIAKAFVDANVAVEKFTMAMTLVAGSSTEAARQFEYVKQVADRLGVGVGDVATAWLKFSAATQGSSLQGDAARIVFEGFATSIAKLGGSSADVSGAMIQLTQGISKGKFELEDLKSIAERVPGFFDKFAKALNITTAELFDLISKGQVGNKEILAIGIALQEAFGSGRVDGFAAELNRLKNALDDTFVTLGNTGVFDALIKAVQVGTASVSGAVVAFETLGKAVGIFFAAVTTGDFGNFAPAIDELLSNAGAKLASARDAMLGLNTASGQTTTTSRELGQALLAGLQSGSGAAVDLEKQAKALDTSLKALGIDPKKFREGTDEAAAAIVKAFGDVANNPAANGDTIVAAFNAGLGKLKTPEQFEQLRVALQSAFNDGKISAEQLTAAIITLGERSDGTTASLDKSKTSVTKVADASKTAADQARRAEEETRKYQLRLEELASNERIKQIEAKVTLNVAEIEAQTKQVQAAFESINTTVSSTGDLIGSSLALLKDTDSLSWSALDTIQSQIEQENKRRQEALDLQKRLTEAQIESLKARTRAMEKGDSIIKIEGANLQPHLEAFMWEILRTIQVRVNKDGLEMLTGV